MDKDELYAAFQRAKIAIPMRRLHEFFEDIDHNKDGFITYEEWRYVYVFLPLRLLPRHLRTFVVRDLVFISPRSSESPRGWGRVVC